ncbi:uncharacterized protein LOC116343360 [Contarinia nasturtii]|uniref:uncharacterized protein LOC116343360 n=1 Tax=Contarinia nasturtii TaxID=265458 RepID=UPI0012D43D34|nr:uncharacterized protein LOC116343360 [Contarinia nasturtii]
MIAKEFVRISFIVVLLAITAPVQSIKVNITKFGNCDMLDPSENMAHFVRMSDISYECDADGYCDTIHAKYNIPTINTADKLMNITMMRCKASGSEPCDENPEHFYEILHCERFHKDESGPWFMISDGMQAAKCGEMTGTFELKNAKLKPEYLTNYMVHDVDFPRHRMIHMVRKAIEGSDEVPIRACIDMEFNIIFQ